MGYLSIFLSAIDRALWNLPGGFGSSEDLRSAASVAEMTEVWLTSLTAEFATRQVFMGGEATCFVSFLFFCVLGAGSW